MPRILFVILLPFFLLISSLAGAQSNNPITINVTVVPPYSTSITDYFTSATQTIVTVLNPSLETYSVFFAGSLTNLSTQQSVTVPNNAAPGTPPLIVPPGLKILNGNDLTTLINTSGIQYSGISEQLVASGNLPEGEYQLCLQAYDYQTLELRSQPDPLGCSNIFTVQYVQPPVLIGPQCESEVLYSPSTTIVFNWVPPAFAVFNGAILNYEFRLVEVPQGMSPINAMQSVTIPVMLQNTLFNTFLYTSLNPALIPGRDYAWRVKVSDLNNTVLFANNGESQVCTFRYGLPDPLLIPMNAVVAFPAPGSKTPFRRVPILVKYEPVDTSYRSFSASTQIRDNQGVHDLVTTQLAWPSGPDAFLQQQLGASPTLTQLQHVQTGRNLATFPDAAELKHQQNYDISAELSFQLSNGDEKSANAVGNFTYGLNKPLVKSPPQDTVFINKNRIVFTFRSSDTLPPIPGQMGMLPPSEVIRALKGSQNNLFKAEVFERYRLEVARDINFDSIVARHSNLLTVEENVTPSTNLNFLKSRIYRDLSQELYVPDTGQYFWRVHWLSNPLDTASAPYETSAVLRFRINGAIAADTIQGACVADCNAPIITDRNPVTTVVAEQTVKVGKFNMKVQTITYLGPMASGTGLIAVPFMNTTIKVKFNDIFINAQGEVYQGLVAASYDTIGFMPNIPGLGKLAINNVEQLMDYVKDGRETSIFDPSIPMGLPLGVDKVTDGERYTVAVVGMTFAPERATLAAALAFPMPFLPPRTSDGKTQHLGLGASDICFHPNGLAGLGIGGLYLAEPVEFDYAPGQFMKFKNSIIDEATGMVADSGTYVSWDCEGFRALHVSGEVSFSKELLERPTKNGSKSLKDVRARFKFTVRRSGNWLAALDFDPFMIKGIDDWNFVVQEATLDFSDLQNPASMVFPANYAGDRSVLWNGFHLKSLKVGLPREFKLRIQEGEPDATGKDSVLIDRVIVAIADLLIDRTGISGKIQALNVLQLENGVMGDWAFSLDTLGVEFVSNSFTRGGFNGKIRTPLTPTLFKYSSVLSQGSDSSGLRYAFNVMPMDTITVPLWAAKMNLLPTSRIDIVADASGFKPELVLNGSIDIVGNIGEVPVRFAGVRFEQLKLNSVAPYLTCQNFVFASPQKEMGGFPVSVSNIQLTQQDYHGVFSWDDTPGPRNALLFTLNVNMMGETNTFAATTTMAVLGRMDPGTLLTGGDEYPSLKLTGLDLKSILIKGDLGFVELDGFISFYAQDPVYGKGFVGGISATFIKSVKVSVIGGFGEINAMRYWYVDALAQFVPGIPLSAPPVVTPIDLYGFGGGAFYKMSLAGIPPPASSIQTKTPGALPPPGSTLSGVRLVPDSTAFFGLKATVILGSTGGGQAFNCDVTLTVVINNHGGMDAIAFDGNGYFATTVMERTFTAVSASVILQFDFPNKTLTGNFSVMVNVPMVMTGTKANNVAGNAYLYAGPDMWQILVGEPTPDEARVGLMLANSFEASGYMMAGMNLPAAPPPPKEVTDILGTQPVARSSAISSGNGFAFGASFTPPKIDDTYLIFNAKLNAGVGFDLNLLDYGSARCDGMNPGERLGLNGWYASGTMWGHFTGSIGMKVQVFGEPLTVDIIQVNAAALMQAGFPNPAWMKATIGGNYNILGGLYQGNCSYKLAIGESCEPAPESPLANMKIISDLSPAGNATAVECDLAPNAVFNVDVNKEFSLPVFASNGTTTNRRVRFIIESFDLKRGTTTIAASRSTSLDGAQAMLVPDEILKEFSSHSVSITVRGEERINGVWLEAKRNNGTAIRETLTRNFTTGARPTRISEPQVAYSYPFHRQRFYPRNQCQNGILVLKQDMGYLFTGSRPGYTRSYFAVFEPASGGAKLEKPATYSASLKRASFEIPTLQASTIYRVRIIHRDVASGGGGQVQSPLASAAFQQMSSQMSALQGGNVLIRERRLSESNALRNNEHLIYEYYFRTGTHGTLNDKINAMTPSNVEREFSSPNENLVLTLNSSEHFERFEMYGFNYAIGFDQQVIRILNMEDTYTSSWHTTFVKPVMYDLYSRIVSGNYTSRRLSRATPDLVGIPPKAIDGTTDMKGPLTDAEINPSAENSTSTPFTGGASSAISGNVFNQTTPSTRIILPTSFYAQGDYNRINTLIADMRTRYGNTLRGVDATTRTKVNTFVATPYKYMFANTNYPVRFASLNPTGCNSSTPTLNTTKSFNYPGVTTMFFTTF